MKNEFVTKDFLKAEIADVKQELKAEIIKWAVGMQVATVTLILAGMKFLIS